MAQRSWLQQAKAIISPLLPEFHKGQAGRVGILGGSREYTGAPFYASASSMRLGCDMSFTICSPEAALPLKTYSPDLIVQPLLDPEEDVEVVRKAFRGTFERLHSLVVGPGLGRDPKLQNLARVAIEEARAADLYLVVDADGLWLVQNDPKTVQGYKRAVLTPNVVEFGRLCDAMNIDRKDPKKTAQLLSEALGGVTILEKGSVDRIATPDEVAISDIQGGLKRCGGQGDLLSGTLGTFLAWAQRYKERGLTEIPEERLPLVAAFGASSVTRMTSHIGFERMGRSMLTHDLLADIGTAYDR
ncbi:ATP-dependent NAD(P)H-hydrate dehydratase [Malassezia brasiliensis]|uniref:ATP-dependent (S)-NAD(P)H-hydrate dehydratase n=1 Tax=Malassezia brasiliensis TaxID=1821822 RepID=A0AAF0IMD8_9BASI|nr:ATP-dependent NAD(P)H-hydrate dehydratase [Malassezia brasiliensis]